MVLGMRPAPVFGELIPGRERHIAAPRAFIAGIHPEPPGLGLACAGCEHVDGRVVGEDSFAPQDMFADGVSQWGQKCRCLANPVRESGAVKVEPVTFEDLALAIKRQVIRIFADKDMRQQPWPRASTFDGTRWQHCLRELFAAFAGKARAGDLVHDEPPRHVLKLLGHILANLTQGAATSAVVLGRQELNVVARDVVWDRTTLRLVLGLIRWELHLGRHCGLGHFARFKRQHELSGLL